MPTLPSNTKCSSLGCKNPKSRFNSFCIEHGGRDTQKYHSTEERDAANLMYQTAQWRTLRKVMLSKQPICQACKQRGIITSANEVDHVFAWRQIGKQAFYKNCFQCLCHDCHASKTQQEKKGLFQDFRGEVMVERTIGDYARLADF